MPDATHETWLPVAGYEGLYEVSDLGRVRSLPRPGGNHRLYGGKILKGLVKTPAYEVVTLSRDGIEARHRVHNLVALTFIGPRPAGQQVRHGPGGALDNRAVNLSYGTPAENAMDKIRDGTVWRAGGIKGEMNENARLTGEIVRECRRRHSAGELQKSLAREYGVSTSTMNRVVRGQAWRHIEQLGLAP